MLKNSKKCVKNYSVKNIKHFGVKSFTVKKSKKIVLKILVLKN